MRAALRSLFVAGALALALGSACLPPDRTTERGAIYVHLRATPLSYDYGSFSVTFEKLTMVLGADTIGCHARFYVDRSSGPVRIVDMTKPYTFEFRAITDESCVVAAGFIQAQDAPVAAPDVPESELRALAPFGTAPKLGTVHLVAHVTYGAAENEKPLYDERVDLLLTGAGGAKSTSNPIPVPHGAKSDVESVYQTYNLAVSMVNLVFYDRNHDGVVTADELDTSSIDAVRRAASDAWTDVVTTSDDQLARELDASSPAR